MVLGPDEVALRKLGSCERITMKLRSILSFTRLTDCSAGSRQSIEGPRDFHKLYKIEATLGRGGFGTVFSGLRLQDKTQVAIKEVYKAKIIKKTADGKMPLEVALMEQVRSVPGVIKILDWFEMPESFFIVMERCRGQVRSQHTVLFVSVDQKSNYPSSTLLDSNFSYIIRTCSTTSASTGH